MGIYVSIILISYNLYPQNLFTLYSLEKQTYDKTKMEVILVDDCSTDDTNSLKNYLAPFPFKYLRSRNNLGRAGAKNYGLKEAQGELIIFLDGEIIVDPNFVANHVRHYSTAEEITVSGNLSHFGTFSLLHPGYSRKQVKHLHSFIYQEPIFLKRLAKQLSLPANQGRDLNKLWQHTKKNKHPIPLISRKDIFTQRFKKLSFPASFFPPQLTARFNDDFSNFHLRWTFFITRNVSIRKSLLDIVGPFNEKFKGWSLEDWELGYRLYKKGVKFIEDREIVSYHQEHPFSKKRRSAEVVANYAKFVMLHPDLEVCVLNLGFIWGKGNILEANQIIDDYYRLNKEFPNEYICAKSALLSLVQQIPLLLATGKPVTNLLSQANINHKANNKKKLLAELAALQKIGRYHHFTNILDLLISL